MGWGDSQDPISVSDLTLAIQGVLQNEFRSVWVTGQVSGLSRPRSGHLYFSLKDPGAIVKAVAWRSVAGRIAFELEDGMEVIARGDIDVYPPQGSYQLIVRDLIPRGIGALELAFRQRFEQLSAEGLFDDRLKRPLPRFPRRIAFVTSPSGAAIRDFLRIVQRRWPLASVLVIPSNVQGAAAAGDLVRGIELANRLQGADRPDLLVVGRGGGSLEDLWCFNEEAVVRAVRASQIPTVSAVGHEIDVCLTDLAADLRCATPSEAAERIVPSREELSHLLTRVSRSLAERLRSRAEEAHHRLHLLASRPVMANPMDRVQWLQQQLDLLERRHELATASQLSRWQQRLEALGGKLQSVSPLSILSRGYAIVSRETSSGRETLVSSEQTSLDESVHIRLHRGELEARVTQVRSD